KKANQQVTDADIEAEIERAAISFGFVDSQGRADIAKWYAHVLEGADTMTIELYKRDAVWPTVALKKLAPPVTVTDQDMKEGFEKNFGRRVEVLAIVLADQRTAHKVWEMARANPTDK